MYYNYNKYALHKHIIIIYYTCRLLQMSHPMNRFPFNLCFMFMYKRTSAIENTEIIISVRKILHLHIFL